MGVERVPQLRCQIYRPLFVAGWPPINPPPVPDHLTRRHGPEHLAYSLNECGVIFC